MMTEEDLLTLKDILSDFRAGNVEQDYVEAHIACLIEECEKRVMEDWRDD